MVQHPLPSGARGELSVAAGFLALSGLVFWRTNTAFAEAGANEGGALFDAAFYPELVAGAMAACAVAQAVRSVRTVPSQEPEHTPTLARALIVAGLFMLWMIAFKPIGYHLTTPVFLAGSFLALGVRAVIALPLALAVSIGMSAVFEWGMNVILPVGIWEIGF